MDDCQLSAYDYVLPEKFIAQTPISPRDHSRMLVVQSHAFSGQLSYSHHHFFELPDFLKPGDLLVLNNTRVIPARLYGQKLRSSSEQGQSGQFSAREISQKLGQDNQLNSAVVEVFLLEEIQFNQWLTLVRPGRKLRPGSVIQFGSTTDDFVVLGYIRSVDKTTGGRIIDFEVVSHAAVRFPFDIGQQSDTLDSNSGHFKTAEERGISLWKALPSLGEVPLPPYITNPEMESERYQTIYSERPGAVAAPTAGLHFTSDLLERLTQMGISQAFVTLHVGIGTFRPVEVEDITQHQMHGEWVEVPEATVAQIQATKQRGGRVIAVGTTVTRSLEAAAQSGKLLPFRDKTTLFIYPGYEWQVIDGLITNFHLPKSSLMMMVSALIGRENLLKAYEEAIAHQYRFYSLGDAMLILP